MPARDPQTAPATASSRRRLAKLSLRLVVGVLGLYCALVLTAYVRARIFQHRAQVLLNEVKRLQITKPDSAEANDEIDRFRPTSTITQTTPHQTHIRLIQAYPLFRYANRFGKRFAESYAVSVHRLGFRAAMMSATIFQDHGKVNGTEFLVLTVLREQGDWRTLIASVVTVRGFNPHRFHSAHPNHPNHLFESADKGYFATLLAFITNDATPSEVEQAYDGLPIALHPLSQHA